MCECVIERERERERESRGSYVCECVYCLTSYNVHTTFTYDKHIP